MAVTAQTESNNTENVFWVLGRVPMFTFDINTKSFIFAQFGVISMLYLFVCMYISYKAHSRFTKETLLSVSDVDVYMLPALRSIPSCTTDMNLRSCILNRHKMRQSQIATIQESLPSHFVIMAVTAQTESNNTENVFWVLGRVPMFTFDMNTKSFIFAHYGVISMLYLIVCMYISYKAHNRFPKETLLIVSDVDVYMFPALRSIPSCTTDMNLRSCILNRHKMRQSQIATIQESLPSHFVICRILWSWPWRHKLSPITLKTCSGYLGEYPGSVFTWIWKVVFLPILVLFHWYIYLCVCLSVIKLIIDVPRKPSWKGPILMWTCFLHLGVHPRLLWNLSEQLCFEPSQIATVTNCDNSGIPAVAICDLSQFVIKAVTAQTESNNIENVFCVLGRVPMITFDRNLWDWV